MTQFILKQNRKLRCGYTTGSCATAAAKAGTIMLLTGEPIKEVSIDTPKRIALILSLVNVEMNINQVSCAIKKDSGDDPDVTNGILIVVTVKKAIHGKLCVEGGMGVGRVTKPGLACKVGEAAINPVPMKMIISEVEKVCDTYGYHEGLDIVVSVPEGEEIAKKTFNPRLGIKGGISILGTTGIVEPMSEAALIDTIRLEMNQQIESGEKHLLVCPGNYGETFIKNELGIHKPIVMCSNYIGEMLDFAGELGLESILLVGHAGKLVKLAAGIMNTHSKYADCRMELLAVHAALNGARNEMVKEIMDCITTEQAIKIIVQANMCDVIFASIMNKVDYYLQNRVYYKLKTGAVIFSMDLGILGKTESADQLIIQHLK